MRCPKCQSDNLENIKFCLICGNSLEPVSRLICPSCETELPHDAKYCLSCGKKIDPAAFASRESKLKTLQQAAPKGLQEKMQDTSAGIEGERKPVTILFADIVGSTAIAENLDPEEWKEVVSGVHRRVGEAIYRYEGTVAQLLGDGLLAFFGAPITHEDDPIRAVRAGLDLQMSIAEYSRSLEGYVDNLQMRVGINTGEVVIGDVGTEMHVEYLAIGDAVNIAARLESAAEPGSILISARCERLIGDDFTLRDLGEISVKGRTESIHVFEVLGARGIPTLRRGITTEGIPYVGRAQEVELLRACVQALFAGQGGVVALLGEAGIGKSRLLEEVRRGIREGEEVVDDTPLMVSSIRWLEGRAISYGGSLSYWTITQLLLDDLGLSYGAPELKIKVALRKRLGELHGDAAMESFPGIARLFGLSEDQRLQEHVLPVDAEAVKRETLLALVDYFRQVARHQPTALILEDLHWSDPSSMEVLEELMALTDRQPLLIIMLMRSERDHGSWRLKLTAETDYPHRYTEVHLERLTEDEADELMQYLLGEGVFPDQIKDLIRVRSEGNPFYLEEVAYHLVENNLIERGDGGWRATEAIEEAGIPETLQGVLLARIDRLEEDVRWTLQMASVIGKSFPYRILEAISEAERELDRHLSQLQRVDLVREKARLPEREYMFKHSLTQETVYNSLLQVRRKEFHLKVGEAIQSLFPERREEFLGLLAHHFEAAGSLEEAGDYLLRAGDQARLSYANTEAIAFYRRALRILGELAEDDTAVKLLMKLGLTCHSAYQFEAAREAYDQAFSVGRGLGQAQERPSQSYSPHPLRFELPDISTLDPAEAFEVASVIVIQQLFRGLLRLDQELNVRPDIAQRWEVLEGGKKYVFNLRENVKWSDGASVKASDFEFAWKKILNPKNRSVMARFLYDIQNARAYHQGEINDPSSVGIVAENDRTLVVILEEPCSYFMYLLTVPVTFPVPEHIVRQNPEGWATAGQVIGNGPFVLERWELGEILVLQRNNEYFGEVLGNVQKIVVKFDYDEAASKKSLERYLNNETDILILPSILMGEVKTLYRRLPEEYLFVPELATVYFGFNVRCQPFDDQRVRLAFALTLDKSIIADVILDGLDFPATGGFIPPGLPAHSGDIGIPFSPDRARELFREAGYLPGVDFPPIEGLGVQATRQILEYAQSQWKDILGVEVRWREVSWPVLVKELDESPPNLYLASWTADYPDPDNFLRTAIWVDETGWRDERFASLVWEARRIPEPEKRVSMYRQAEHILMQEMPIIPLTYGRNHYLIKPWVRAGPLYSTFAVPNLEYVIIDPH